MFLKKRAILVFGLVAFAALAFADEHDAPR